MRIRDGGWVEGPIIRDGCQLGTRCSRPSSAMRWSISTFAASVYVDSEGQSQGGHHMTEEQTTIMDELHVMRAGTWGRQHMDTCGAFVRDVPEVQPALGSRYSA